LIFNSSDLTPLDIFLVI